MLRIISIVAVFALAPVAPAQLLLNEIRIDVTDYIELINAGSSPVDLSGYVVKTYESRGNSTPCNPAGGSFGLQTEYVFPAGLYTLAPGAVVQLLESGTQDQVTGNVVRTGKNMFFNDYSDFLVWIEDGAGTVVDLVPIGDSELEEMVSGGLTGITIVGQWSETMVVRPVINGDIIARVNNPGAFDTNTALEWLVLPVADASPALVNPQMLGDSPLGSLGRGTAQTGNCGNSGNTNDATVLPVLTFTDYNSLPAVGGSFRFKLHTGMTSPPTQTTILFGASAFQPGLPVCPGLGGPELWVNPFLSAGGLFATFDTDGGAESVPLAIAAGSTLAGVTLFCQGFMLDPGEPCVPLRSTQVLQFTVQ